MELQLMAQKYPQGLKKNPIKVVNPNGTVTKYNSYREAMDASDNMGKAVMNEHFSPLGGQEPYDKADKQARKEGYDRPNLGGLEPVMDKIRTTRGTVEKRNADWMAKTAAKKPSYAGQSNVSKLMGVTKAGKK
jgi:hypothetical protein